MPRRVMPAAWLLLLAVLAIAGVGGTAKPASAYTQLFRPFAGQPLPDPCAQLGIGANGGLVVREQPNPGKPSIKRYVAVLCGPRRSLPPSILLADDQIWQYAMGQSGHTDTHMLRGGLAQVPWNSAISTKNYPYYKGPNGHGAAFPPDQIGQQQILEQMWEALREIITEPDFGVSVVECVLGALESEGAECLELLVTLAIVAIVEVGIVLQPLFQIVSQFLESRNDMSNGDWFYWSDGTGFWNGFGDVAPDWINPSITLTDPLASHDSRIGVVFSNVALDQGPDFALPGADRPGARARGRQLFGSDRGERLIGTNREDFIDGGGGNDLIRGNAGIDVLLQGGRGDDRIFGGPGGDNIDGGRGLDVLHGGPGNDQIVDVFGPTTVHAGAGTNLVIVRDGRGDDRVDCRGSRRNVVHVDRGDRVDRSCRTGRSRIVRGGPRLRIGVGY